MRPRLFAGNIIGLDTGDSNVATVLVATKTRVTVRRMDDLPLVLGGTPLLRSESASWPGSPEAVRAAMIRAWQDGTWGLYEGPHSRELCAAIRELHGRSGNEADDALHVELLASGTLAVELTLRAAGVGPGDEVIVAAYDYPGNFYSVLACGAVPVLVDVELGSCQLDVTAVSEAVSDRTRAIIASHLHGAMVEMERLRKLADRYGLFLVEDAAQMPGAEVGGRRAGGWGHAGVVSFGGSKLLSAGRGGAVVTRDDHFLLRLRRVSMRGPNHFCSLSELQAAVLVPQVRELEGLDRQRALAVARIGERLKDFPWLRLFQNRTRGRPGYYKVGMWFDARAAEPLTREAFIWAMRAEGIPLAAGFRALHVGRSPRRYRRVHELVNATAAHECVVVLHHTFLLRPLEEVELFAVAAHRIFEHRQAVMNRFGAGA